MSILAIFLAVLLEQARPLPPSHGLRRRVEHWQWWLMHHLDANAPLQAWLVWGLAVALPALLSYLIYALLLHGAGSVAALGWTVFVLYAALGFRPFKQFFTAVRNALDAGDTAQAHIILQQCFSPDGELDRRWRNLPAESLLPLALKVSILLVHRHFFGLLAFFSLLAWLDLGPMGAVLFRSAEHAWRHWGEGNFLHPLEQRASGALQKACQQAWHVVNWVPARCTGLLFAAAGNFEGALTAWRSTAHSDPADTDAAVLAAVAGAMNMPLRQGRNIAGVGGATRWEPDGSVPDGLLRGAADAVRGTDGLQQLANLIWRALLLWMALLLMGSMIALVA